MSLPLAASASPRESLERRTRSRRRIARALGVFGVSIAGATAFASCASVPDNARLTVLAAEDGAPLEPDYAIYKAHVNEILERQCGTLDCHGQAGRAYRLYSRSGLRIFNPDASLGSGLNPTTEEEKRYNFQSLVTIQPEEMRRVMARNGTEPETLIFLRKPLKIERHKGGQVIAFNGPAYKCITGWLRVPIGGTLDLDSEKSCKSALEVR